MSILKKVYEWFVYSSKDPAKLALTIKGIAAFAVLFGVDSVIVDEGVGHMVNIVTALGMLLSAGAGSWGFVRKIWITIHS